MNVPRRIRGGSTLFINTDTVVGADLLWGNFLAAGEAEWSPPLNYRPNVQFVGVIFYKGANEPWRKASVLNFLGKKTPKKHSVMDPRRNLCFNVFIMNIPSKSHRLKFYGTTDTVINSNAVMRLFGNFSNDGRFFFFCRDWNEKCEAAP